MRLGSDKCEDWQSQSKTTLTIAYQQWEKSDVASELIQAKNIVVGGTLIYTFLSLTLTLFEFWLPIYAKGLTFRISKRPKMQVTNRSQMSLRVHWVSRDLRNPSDLHCQLSVGLIVTAWGFADFYTVILTRSWLNNPNLDPWPRPLMSLGSN